MNILTAVFVYTLFFSQVGLPDQRKVVVSLIAANSPAEQAGLKTGDVVISAGGQAVKSTQQLINITYTSLGKPLPLVIERNGQPIVFLIQGDHVREVAVKTGRRLGEMFELNEGPPVGSRIATTPLDRLKDGVRISIPKQ